MNISRIVSFGGHKGRTRRLVVASAVGLAVAGLSLSAPVMAQYKQELRHEMRRCSAGSGPAVLVTIDGVRNGSGVIRVQSYRATAADWMQKGRWLSRIEVPAQAGSMAICVPVSSEGSYGIAVRHDVNGNGSTDLRTDGGAISNNPSINVFNLGKPSVSKAAFDVGHGVRAITVHMKYM